MADHDDILTTARKRYSLAIESTKENRDAALADIRFLNGEQWNPDVKKEREAEGLPCITINRMPQFLGQVTNELRMNRPSIKVTAADDKADKETAEIMSGLIRQIEYSSMADVAYDNAGEIAAAAGYRGYIRVITRHTSDDSFDQDILVRPVWNSFSVADDPFITEPDQSDRRWCILSELMSKEEFEKAYPDASGEWTDSDGEIREDWKTKDSIRVAEYWWKEEKSAVIVLMEDGSVIDEEELKKLDPATSVVGVSLDAAGRPRTRKVRKPKVRWCKMTSSQVLEGPHDWSGRYIPIVHVDPRVQDEEGKKIWSGVIRHAKGAQELYNYSRSKWAEVLALAPKAPWLATRQQTDGLEDVWSNANRRATAWLPYNHIEGQHLPQRIMPPPTPTGIIEEAQQSVDDMKATTGIYDASLGNRSNEQSGRAINARQAQTDKANFSFLDNLTRSIRVLGKVLVDLIPKIYDTQRVVRVRGEDGSEASVMVNQVLGDIRLRDLSMGKYDVIVTAGPSYASQRLEAADAMLEMIRAVPQIAPYILDIVAEGLNFPNAEKIAERVKLAMPPQLTGQQQQPQQPDPMAANAAVKAEADARSAMAKAQMDELNSHKAHADTAAYAMDMAAQAQGAGVPPQGIPAPAGM